MASNQLTTLDAVKAWVMPSSGGSSDGDNALLTRLISSSSRFILNFLERPTLFQNNVTDTFDGVDQRSQMLTQWPVLSVSSLSINTTVITAAPDALSTGYILDPWNGFPPGSPQRISLRGYGFCRGRQNISVTYVAGFAIQNEPQTVPAGSAPGFAVDAPHGSWAVDQGVTYASSGIALTPIKTGTPGAGQYLASAGTYTFSSADIGQAVLISYSYVPADVEDACINLVAERYKYRDRIGQMSKSLNGQETVSYSQKDMPDYMRTALQPYKSYVMV